MMKFKASVYKLQIEAYQGYTGGIIAVLANTVLHNNN